MKYIVANHKNCLSLKEVLEYREKLLPSPSNKLVVCPNDMFLYLFKDSSFSLGSQYVSNIVPFTGGASVDELVSMNVKYTIVGHRDNRVNNGENIDNIVSKIKLLLDSGITPIVCLGNEKKSEVSEVLSTLSVEINKMLNEISTEDVNKIIFAYEPYWAINNPEVLVDYNYVENIISSIKNTFDNLCDNVPAILYGGSVNLSNISELNKIDIIDGFLIGGASTKVDIFNNIIKKIS